MPVIPATSEFLALDLAQTTLPHPVYIYMPALQILVRALKDICLPQISFVYFVVSVPYPPE